MTSPHHHPKNNPIFQETPQKSLTTRYGRNVKPKRDANYLYYFWTIKFEIERGGEEKSTIYIHNINHKYYFLFLDPIKMIYILIFTLTLLVPSALPTSMPYNATLSRQQNEDCFSNIYNLTNNLFSGIQSTIQLNETRIFTVFGVLTTVEIISLIFSLILHVKSVAIINKTRLIVTKWFIRLYLLRWTNDANVFCFDRHCKY